MADLTITAASVIASSTAKIRKVVAGATITCGQVVYEDTSDSNKAKLADANSATASVVAGIALQNVGAGQPLDIVYEDDALVIGATLSLSVGTMRPVFILSATAGAIGVAADLAATMYPVILGVAQSTTVMKLKITNGTGVLTA